MQTSTQPSSVSLATARQSQRRYIPARGDIIWCNFDTDRVGHEQQGIRPAIVLSKKVDNEEGGLAVVCPITTKPREKSFEVTVPNDPSKFTRGVVLTNQVTTIDYTDRGRGIDFIETASQSLLNEVIYKVNCRIGHAKS
jgi:mRNA interferase MazF